MGGGDCQCKLSECSECAIAVCYCPNGITRQSLTPTKNSITIFAGVFVPFPRDTSTDMVVSADDGSMMGDGHGRFKFVVL